MCEKTNRPCGNIETTEPDILYEEFVEALRKLKKGKLCGTDSISAEVFLASGETGFQSFLGFGRKI